MIARSLLTAVVLGVIAAPASAQISTNHKVLAPFKAVVSRANESTVQIRCDNKQCALGTVVFADGFILTKASELRGLISVRLYDGTEYEAKIVGQDRKTDLALLRVDVQDLKPVSFADTAKVTVGSWLATPAGPNEALRTVESVGIVSVAARKLSPPDSTDIFNHNKGFIGIRLADTDPKDEEGKVIGAKVVEVTGGGAGEKGGVKKNDIIIEVEGVKVAGRVALQEALENSRPGDTVKVTLLREGKEEKLKIKLGGENGPKGRSDIQNAMGGELSGRRTGFPAILQTDMVVEPKNCGGPVVDLQGNVLGVNIARAGRVETWILPSEYIRPLLADLKAGKFAPASAIKSEK